MKWGGLVSKAAERGHLASTRRNCRTRADHGRDTSRSRRWPGLGPAKRVVEFLAHDGSAEDDIPDKATRWRTVVGPLFGEIWPLDARLRGKSTTRNFVLMALECGDAFPEAVETILDFIVPYELYVLQHSLRFEQHHSDLLWRYPLAFVNLANALIDPALFRVPSDLGTFLQECTAADPNVVRDPAYIRLHGLRRQQNA